MQNSRLHPRPTVLRSVLRSSVTLWHIKFRKCYPRGCWESLFPLKGTELLPPCLPRPPALNVSMMPGSASAIHKNEKVSEHKQAGEEDAKVTKSLGPQWHPELLDQTS